MPQIIEVTISPLGETTIQTKGFAGNTCQDASKFLELALGVSTGERKTAEFYDTAPAQQQIQQ